MRKIAEGAEADIYEDEVLGVRAILKQRREKPYLERALELELRTQRTRNEARAMGVASENGLNVPYVLAVGPDSIHMSRIPGKRVLEVPPRERLTAMAAAGRTLRRLHALGIAHGDFTPANMLVDMAGALWLIDFGLSLQHASIEDKALDVLLLKRSVGKPEYTAFSKAYLAAKGSLQVMRKLAEIERRGRYQSRSLESS